MDFSTLKQLSKVYPILVKPFDLFDATTVTDQDIQTKIDSVIQYMNSLGQSNNDTVRSWNKVMQWVMDEGLTDSVNAKIDDMMANGTFNDLLTTLTNSLLGSEVLGTVSQDVKGAINEVLGIANANALALGSEALVTANKDVKGAINEVKGIADANTSALADIVTINPKTYGAIGDGVTDDTTALQNAINALPNNGTFKLPKGVFRFTALQISNKTNCRFVFDGVLKVVDGWKEMNGNFIINGTNTRIIFDNLNIDGNSSTITTTTSEFGIYTALVIGGSAKKITFNNLVVMNTTLAAVVANGNVDSVKFNGVHLENIGEHCFYISGGNNTNFAWKDVIIVNFGQNPVTPTSHEVYVFKNRCDTYNITNQNFVMENVKILSQTGTSRVCVLLGGNGIYNFVLKNVVCIAPVYLILISTYTNTPYDFKDVTFENLNTTGGLCYTLADQSRIFNITMKNSTINYSADVTLIQIFSKFINTKFDGMAISTDSSGKYLVHDMVFDNCDFINQTGAFIKLTDVSQNITFHNCRMYPNLASSIPNPATSIGNGSFSIGKRIRFSQCLGDITNYNGFIIVSNGANIEIFNSEILGKADITGSGNSCKIFNSKLWGTTTNLARYSFNFTKAILRDFIGVDGSGNDINKTKQTGSVTVNSGQTTTSISVNSNNITLAPNITSEHLRLIPTSSIPAPYWITYNQATYTYTITFASAVASNVTFDYVVDVTTKGY